MIEDKPRIWKDKSKINNKQGIQAGLDDFQPQPDKTSHKVVPKVPQETKVVDKLKSKAEIRKTIKINAQVQILNGVQCIRYKNVPTILLDMKPPADYHKDAQQNFAMWFKLENKEYMSVVKQLKPHLKELTFWFNPDDEKKLKEFMSEGNG